MVRVFFTNLSFVDDIICEHVKGVDMVIINDEWKFVTGLKSLGRVVRKGIPHHLNDSTR